MEKLKQKACVQCGTIFTYERERKTLCGECSRRRQAELAKIRRKRIQEEMPMRRCPICGGPIAGKRRRYCDHCSSLDGQQRQQLKKRKLGRKDGPAGLGLEEIVALTKQYRPPYGTYGKLKSYIYMTGKLPPEEYRK